ncbi:hypothetical protein LVJ94_52990 [Pendulispora rubella]|uniref:Secreted protein n=1 Tax=Pendulispora rubella TaxID=2741070 RepID=A0ABZ2L3T5_9BACT
MKWMALGCVAMALGCGSDEGDDGDTGQVSQPAVTAANFPRLDAATVDGYQLTAGSTFTEYGNRITELEKIPQLRAKGVSDVLASANRNGRNLCHPTHLNANLNPKGFCWQDGEDDDENVWVPQGVTGSGDANPGTGTVNGRRIVLATWHSSGDTFLRVSFADVTDLAHVTYRHVLLVEPTSNTNFAAIAGHGHGLTWFGNRLFVATAGSVIRVFDLRHLWSMDTGTSEVGRGSDGKYHARYHAFALPQVGAYWYPGGGACANTTGARPCFASLGFDHTGGGSLVAAEHVPREKGRVVRWPMDRTSGLLATQSDQRVHASEGFLSPVWAMQGAVARDGYFVLTGLCPEYADDPPADRPSCLHGGVGGVSTSRLGQAPVNSENLSYWPATGELWLINEQLRERVTVHIPWPG